jgi:hypothetical protein
MGLLASVLLACSGEQPTTDSGSGPPIVEDTRTLADCSLGVAARDRDHGYGTVQRAMDHAEPGGEVIVCPGRWEVGTLYVTKSLTLRGEGDAADTVLDGGGLGPVLVVTTSRVDLSLQSLSVEGGLGDWGGGLSHIYGGTLDLWQVRFANNVATESVISENQAQFGAGMIASGDDRGMVAEGLVIRDNSASEYGGGVYVWGSSRSGPDLYLSHSEITGNHALDGGGIYEDSDYSSVELTGVLISQNVADRDGGGIWAANGVQGEGIALNNNAADRGGGLWTRAWGWSSLDASSVLANSATAGGGVWLEDGTLLLSDVDFGAGEQDNSPDDLATSSGLSEGDLTTESECNLEGCE